MAVQHKVRIHSVPQHPNVTKSEIVGKFGGVTIEYIEGFEMGKTNKTEHFLTLNPNGQIPTAETPDGPLWESNAIAYYVARIGTDAKGLLGETPYQQSLVDQWVNFTRSRVEGLYGMFLFHIGRAKYDKEKFDQDLKRATDAFAVLERHFSSGHSTYLVGNRITIADIILICHLLFYLRKSISEVDLKPYPKTRAYIDLVLKNEHVHSVTGPVEIPAVFVPPQ